MLDKNGNRMLAYVQEISDIQNIKGADNIQLAHVLGWTLIVLKNEFKPGDKCAFFEIDSLVSPNTFFKPDGTDVFEFLKPKKYHVKTYKLNKFGVISQGLILPLSYFNLSNDLEINTDLTETLKVTYAIIERGKSSQSVSKEQMEKNYIKKHSRFFKNPVIKLLMKNKRFRKLLLKNAYAKKNKNGFPTQYIKKTDEERIQNMPWILTDKTPWIATEKIDGTSTTFLLVRHKQFYVCSRNRALSKEDVDYEGNEDNIYWEMAEKYNIKKVLTDYLKNNRDIKWVCIQGESYGEGWQSNRLKIKGHSFAAFNFIDSKNGRWNSLKGKELLQKYDIPWVPIINENFILPDSVDEMLEIATGKSLINPECLREGIVFRSVDDNTKSFKAVSPEYLMKHGV